ncbi:hypothetical protein VNO77_39485 [Canavalia gladiata]|uniref:NAD-dependent epimerase/dehydratase domain-containing protein n=1 Tax=Canavalia gladiata TaxID=3824 RepID=A0AAN9PX63_CANGL
MEGSKGRVCVTGGAGFIASSIIETLLLNGYSVNTTVRSHPEYEEDPSFLYNIDGASQRLQVFNADLSNSESFNGAIEGCIGVFHVATPVDFELGEPEEVLTKRSIDGALGILKACLNSKTVKRVVYTSSASAVTYNGKEEEVILDENSWSDVNYLRVSKPFGWSYAISKTLTEKAVLEFGEQNGLDVVTLIPALVFGPFICPKLPSSVGATLNFIFGKCPFGLVLQIPMVHVDDVARAHIFLLEHSNPKGRYCCSHCLVTFGRISELFSAKYPEFQPLIVDSLKQIEGTKLSDLSSKKLIDAGFVFKYGLEEMLDDAIQCCKEKDYL